MFTTTAFGSDSRSGGIAHIVLKSDDLDSLDYALSYNDASFALVDTTCARLIGYSDTSLSKGLRLEPEVATGFPHVSRDRKTYTFTLRRGFRFNDGTPVRANAFANSINRLLAPAVKSKLAPYMQDIVGADRVLAGKADAPTGVVAHGLTLVIRLTHPLPDFLFRVGSLCAVPPTLPPDPEGAGRYPAAGPYYISDYRADEKVSLRRNPFYAGRRPHHVDGFDVDLSPTGYGEVLDKIERGGADWGWAPADEYREPVRHLVAKYGVNRSRFFLTPGFGFFGFALNSSRPLFRDNPKLRQAINFAVDRTALRRLTGGLFASRATDQYLPPLMPGYEDARIYPLDKPDLTRAEALARGNTRSGRAVLYTVARPEMIAAAQQVKSDLAKIGLDVEIKAVSKTAWFYRIAPSGQFDIGFQPWGADYFDPFSVLNVLFDGSFIGSTNWGRFDSPYYNRLLRRAASLKGEARFAAYGALDVKLARDAAPMLAVSISNTPTLVSKRTGCRVFRPQLDLTAMCLR